MSSAAYPAAAANVTEITVTAEKRQQSLQDLPVRTTQSELGDYKLYSLVEPTTLAARQTKQIRFLHQRGVKFDKLYVFRADDWYGFEDQPIRPAMMVLRFQNKAGDGLGLPLPSGEVSVRQPQAIAGGADLFIGDRGLRDVPVGEEFELPVSPASDIQVKARVVSNDDNGQRVTVEFTVTNAKPQPVAFELRQRPEGDDFKIFSETRRHVLKNGDDVWRLKLPANGSVKLGYTFGSD